MDPFHCLAIIFVHAILELRVQVVTTVDPFGYYAEGIQQKLDDAFVEGEQGPDGSTPAATPSAESSRPAESMTFRASEDKPQDAAPRPEAEGLERTQVRQCCTTNFCL